MIKKEVLWRQTPWGDEPVCPDCGGDLIWQDCEHCEDGFSYHDCGEDTCCCLNPEPNVPCDVCDGKGGLYVCYGCDKEEEKVKP